MKKISSLLFLAIALSGFLFTGCEKEATKAAMIIKTWNLETKTIAGINVATACETDSKWNFKADGTYAIYDDCDNTKTGTWQLAEDATSLTLDDVTIYQVVEISIGSLIIEMQIGGVDLVRWTLK